MGGAAAGVVAAAHTQQVIAQNPDMAVYALLGYAIGFLICFGLWLRGKITGKEWP